MPKDFEDQDLRGWNFENRKDLRDANFSRADIRGAKFTGACLVKAEFIGAQAGVQKGCMALQVFISFVLCYLFDFGGILLAVVFTAFLLNPNFPQNTSVLQHIEMLLIQAVIYFPLAWRGFTAKARNLIAIGVVFVLAGASAVAIHIAGASAVGVVGSALVAGVVAVAFAGVLALALALALAVAGALAGVLAFALAFALALAGAGAFAGGLASAIAGTGANANALARALVHARTHALVIALAALLLSLYIAWQSSKEDEKFEPAHLLGLWLGMLGGTSFKTAETNLSDADFSHATLNNCDFSHALVTRTRFTDAKGLKRASLEGTILGDKAVRDLLVTGQGQGQNYRGKNLQGANLAGADLRGADFTEADISGAVLEGADLTGANLTKTQALGAVFHDATLTGACLEAWNIDSTTRLEGAICDYVYLLNQQRECRPSSGKFGPGEFTKLFQEVLDTVDFIFRSGIDWSAFLDAFMKLQAENEGTKLTVQCIENKGDGVVAVRVSVPPDADKEKLHSKFNQLYEMNLKLLDVLKEKDEYILMIHREHSADILTVIKLLAANRHININAIKTMTQDTYNVSNTGQLLFNVKSKFENVKMTINTSPFLQDNQRIEFQVLLDRLNEAITPVLEKRPEDAQRVLNSVETVAGELGRKEPDKSFLNSTIEGLKRAATAVKDIAPSVLDVTEKILAFVTRITGGA